VHVCNFITTQIRDKHCKYYCNNSKHTKNEKHSFKVVPRGGTSAEGTGGSIRTSRYSALRKVADHRRCRRMFTVQSRERPPGRRRRCSSPSRSARTSTRKKTKSSITIRRTSTRKKITNSPVSSHRRRSPKIWLPATPEQMSRCKASGSGGLLSWSLCAQRFGTGMDRKQLNKRED